MCRSGGSRNSLRCGLGRSLLAFPLAQPAEQLLHATGELLRAVDRESQLRDVANAHAFAEFGADVTARGHKTGKRRGLFSLAAVDGDEDAGALSSGREHHIRNVAGCDPRIGEFALEHRANLFGEGAGDALAVAISGSVFW